MNIGSKRMHEHDRGYVLMHKAKKLLVEVHVQTCKTSNTCKPKTTESLER
eukprot:m.12017 g.12017  ORF g.12017 m.12017 type:complete len:50 (-) comp5796_c0_seq2:3015-3164(-)